MGALMSMYNCVKLEATRESQAKVRKYYDDWSTRAVISAACLY